MIRLVRSAKAFATQPPGGMLKYERPRDAHRTQLSELSCNMRAIGASQRDRSGCSGGRFQPPWAWFLNVLRLGCDTLSKSICDAAAGWNEQNTKDQDFNRTQLSEPGRKMRANGVSPRDLSGLSRGSSNALDQPIPLRNSALSRWFRAHRGEGA